MRTCSFCVVGLLLAVLEYVCDSVVARENQSQERGKDNKCRYVQVCVWVSVSARGCGGKKGRKRGGCV